ncbi:ABC transporter ATP-binding protein [Halovenus salina]|uniref:ABC transporter ATP-binding protein n=1 Tax=Halovenus salina TaxID=1510225 RepID=A0ABD5W3S4_9EURY
MYTVGDQIAEAITFHQDVSGEQARERAIDLLGTVGLSRPAERVDEYPHELSDGMCQRVAIAIALAAEPDLLIADEPVSALDVMIQGRIIDLLDDLRKERDFSLVLVTHDLRVVASLADRMVVLYGGTDVERGTTADVLQTPAHPYSQDLFASFTGDGERGDDLATRDPIPPQGCRFHRECAHAVDDCRDSKPPFAAVEGDDAHRVSCVHYGPERDPGEILFEARRAGAAFDDPEETPKQTAEADGGDSRD